MNVGGMEVTHGSLYRKSWDTWERDQFGEGLAHYPSEVMLSDQPYACIACTACCYT